MSNQEPRHTPQADEPDYLPSQAEGNEQQERMNEHLRTPGKAEGEREAVEETLAHQPEEAREDKSLWDRVKALLGL